MCERASLPVPFFHEMRFLPSEEAAKAAEGIGIYNKKVKFGTIAEVWPGFLDIRQSG